MSLQKKILFIVNPISGVGKKNTIPPLIERHLDHSTFSHEITYTTHRGHGHELAAAQKENYDVMVAVGGDGSVNEIGSALIGSSCAIAILPCGSGNGLARHAGIPLKLDAAIARINNYNPVKIDTGKINDHIFIGTCGFGFDGHIAKKFDEFKTRGFLSYVRLTVREYRRYKPVEVEFKHDNERVKKTALFCSVANSSQFGNSFTISPLSDITDGKFELVFIKKTSLFQFPFIAWRFFRRNIHQSRYFESVDITTNTAMTLVNGRQEYFHVDGEPVGMSGNFNIQIFPSSLILV